ncbi:hypothetical protein [Vibrio gallaecicus]|uniref:hypothetical protein n=1 Tax=Vibrio gallaecicus TaxID=552386 RepID=UPI0025B345AF|nr:hypothetical protein [Vibrio gallaecicus]MDN3615477.1 hypothetical protein [Vibrio gallaecicus]
MNTDFKTIIYRSKHVILKLLPFQQNGNELTVPKLSKLNFVLVTQFIETKLISEEILLCYCKTNFDIHQRVPTQIDRFKLLKSFAFSALALKQDAHNTLSTLKVNIKY